MLMRSLIKLILCHWALTVRSPSLFHPSFSHLLQSGNDSAEAIPLQSLGVVDVAATAVPDNELLANALLNVSQSDKVDGWAVKRSADFVNEYPRVNENGARFAGSTENLNHLLGSFPCLFPFGLGGFEVDRPVKVSYENHAHWALHYDDKRFRKDHHFMFQVFGVIQKRQLCASAALQISKRTFLRFENAIRNLQTSDFDTAVAQERSHEAFTDPTMKALRETVNTVCAKVLGTDESRIQIRSLIWGMKNPPSLWLTINPADTQDPIAQVLCGENIDLDHFCSLDHRPNTGAVAADPFASASFFHIIINAVLHHLLKIKGFRSACSLERQQGIFGTVDGFIGTVEAQGRGTFHLHMLLWLKGSVPSSEMKKMLSTDEFRDRVKSFISANIHGDINDMDGPSILSTPRDPNVAFSRPIDPRLPNYDALSRAAEINTARTLQVHQCTHACLKLKKGRWACKRRAPFPLASAPWIDKHGNWGPKRRYGYMNSFCPPLLQAVRCNHDIKLVTNGKETKNMAWYITKYVAKKQNVSTNTSALLAKMYAFHRDKERRTTDLTVLNKKLIQRCANTLTWEQELSAPEVVSYLMGWSDRFISHHFETIHWYSVVDLLKKSFPIL